MSKSALFIIHRARPGRRDEVRDVWLRHMRPAVEGNPAHLAYFYCYDAVEPDVIRVFQQYTDEAAAAQFLTTDAYAGYVAEVEPLLAAPPEVHPATPVWAKA